MKKIFLWEPHGTTIFCRMYGRWIPVLLYRSFPASLFSCIPHYLHPFSASCHSCIPSVLHISCPTVHPSCPASFSPASLLSYIQHILHPFWSCLLSCIPPALRSSYPHILHPTILTYPVLYPS